MKSLLLFVLILTIVSCNPDPVAVQKADKPTSTNISFTPEIINLSPLINDYRIVFTGIDFIKCPVDSICLENTRINIESAGSDSLSSKLIKKDSGDFRVFMYFKSGLIILDKKIKIVPFEYKEPSADNIMFSPDTIKLNEANQDFKLIFKGTDFNKYKIDSIFIDNVPVYISIKTQDSLTSYISKFIIGTFNVHIYYKGIKITLPKKLIIVNELINFNFNSSNKFHYEIVNVPVINYYIYCESYMFNGFCDTTISDLNFSINPPTDIVFTKIEFVDSMEIHLSNKYGYTYIDLILVFDKHKNKLKSFYYNYQKIGSSSSSNQDDFLRFKFENIPYMITKNQNGGDIFTIDIKGKEINNYLPLTFKSDRYTTGRNTRISYNNYFLTKKDSLTGKEINYYPANDDSRIKFVIY